MENSVDYDKLLFTEGNKKIYGFKNFRTLGKLIKSIYNRDMAIDEAEIKQNEFAGKIDELRAYSARVSKNIYLKESASNNTKKFYDRWEEIVSGFKNEILRLSKRVGMRTDSDDQQPNILDTPEQKRFKTRLKKSKRKTWFYFKRFLIMNISPHSLTMMNTVNTEFSSVEVGSQTKSGKHLKLKIMSIWH